MLPIRAAPPCIDAVCDGTAAERGAALGSALRSLLRESAGAVLELEAFQRLRPWWLPLSGFAWLADRRARQTLQSVLATESFGHWARLVAMSDAAGVPVGRVALLNALEPVLSNLRGGVTTATEAACSALGVSAARSATGGAIVAHNFDYLPRVQPYYIVRDERAAPGRLRSLQFTLAPLTGAVDGINEAGLAVTYNYGYATDRAVAAPTISMRLAEVLAECRSVTEAVSQLVGRSRWGAGLIMLADAAGEVASLELTSTTHAARSPNENNVLAHTNGFCSAATRAVEIPRNSRHGPRAPLSLRGRRVHQSTECRDARFVELAAEVPRFALDDIERLMGDHGADGRASADTICMHGDYWHTTACVQLLPRERRLRIKYAPACVGEFVEFAL